MGLTETESPYELSTGTIAGIVLGSLGGSFVVLGFMALTISGVRRLVSRRRGSELKKEPDHQSSLGVDAKADELDEEVVSTILDNNFCEGLGSGREKELVSYL